MATTVKQERQRVIPKAGDVARRRRPASGVQSLYKALAPTQTESSTRLLSRRKGKLAADSQRAATLGAHPAGKRKPSLPRKHRPLSPSSTLPARLLSDNVGATKKNTAELRRHSSGTLPKVVGLDTSNAQPVKPREITVANAETDADGPNGSEAQDAENDESNLAVQKGKTKALLATTTKRKQRPGRRDSKGPASSILERKQKVSCVGDHACSCARCLTSNPMNNVQALDKSWARTTKRHGSSTRHVVSTDKQKLELAEQRRNASEMKLKMRMAAIRSDKAEQSRAAGVGVHAKSSLHGVASSSRRHFTSAMLDQLSPEEAHKVRTDRALAVMNDAFNRMTKSALTVAFKHWTDFTAFTANAALAAAATTIQGAFRKSVAVVSDAARLPARCHPPQPLLLNVPAIGLTQHAASLIDGDEGTKTHPAKSSPRRVPAHAAKNSKARSGGHHAAVFCAQFAGAVACHGGPPDTKARKANPKRIPSSSVSHIHGYCAGCAGTAVCSRRKDSGEETPLPSPWKPGC